jgi:sugar lactone lactonase YvrE
MFKEAGFAPTRWWSGALACLALNACGGGGGGGPTPAPMYLVGGTASGLSGSTVVLQINGGGDLPIAANGSFSFSTSLAAGTAYVVTVTAQPSAPAQTCLLANATGSAGITSASAISVTCTTDLIALLAGQLGGSGNIDGVGKNARFSWPGGAAIDNAGNLYVADRTNQLIRKITPAGVVSTIAGIAGVVGAADGPGNTATFNSPNSVAVDSAGNLFVADSLNNTIRKISAAGVVSTLAGTVGQIGWTDGPGSTAQFSDPMGVATDGAGNVYVADSSNSAIRLILPTGVVSTYAGSPSNGGSGDGTGSAAQFVFPLAIASDGNGNLFVVDSITQTLRKIAPGAVVTTLAGSPRLVGSADGVGSAARFNNPSGVTVDGNGNIYVADFSNYTVRKVTPAGVVTTLAGVALQRGTTDGAGNLARFGYVAAIITDAAGNLFVGDVGYNTIRKVDTGANVTTFAGTAVSPGSADGTRAAAQFNNPQGVTVDPTGTLYLADNGNYTIRVITPTGTVSTLAGTVGVFGASDGSGSNARFGYIGGIAADANSNVFVADEQYDTIRKVTPTGIVTTIAGRAGVTGSTDGVASSALFKGPSGAVIDGQGNLFIADTGNYTIRKIDAAGNVTTFAGTSGAYGHLDGTGSAARFASPKGLAIDSSGNIYVSETINNTIRMITPNGTVTTLAGQSFSTGSADGTGSAALFNGPTSLAVDSQGDVYVADTGNYTIRKITPAGVVTTIVGAISSIGVRLGALPGSLGGPQAIALIPGATKRLLEADAENAILTIDVP